MSARSSRRCHAHEHTAGRDARNPGVGSAEPAVGPELSERVEQVRAALPDADRAWFKQELDQGWTWPGRPGTCGRSATLSRAGGG
jgi:hypothetical protein